MQTMHFRTIWISDVHLGGKDVNTSQLLDFLRCTHSDHLYLVGDIIDFWQIRRKCKWAEVNDAIIQLIIQKAQNGTKVIYIPGNHDKELRKYGGLQLNNIHIRNEAIHETASGTRLLVLHGDKFDSAVQNSAWLTAAGNHLYDRLLGLNRWLASYRKLRGKPYFSISAWLKQKIKLAVNYIGDFENVLVQELRKQQVDGVICGHIHHASIRNINGFLYSNSGDWVESCTALAENFNGTLGIIQWPALQPTLQRTKIHEQKKNTLGERCMASTN